MNESKTGRYEFTAHELLDLSPKERLSQVLDILVHSNEHEWEAKEIHGHSELEGTPFPDTRNE